MSAHAFQVVAKSKVKKTMLYRITVPNAQRKVDTIIQLNLLAGQVYNWLFDK
jgi:hypothetical protein